MATLNGINYALINSEPSQKVTEGQVTGRTKFWYDEITLSAEVAAADVILFGSSLPENARVIDAGLLSGALGAPGAVNCQVKFGTASDDDAFIAQSSVAAAVKLKMASEAGFLAVQSSSVQPQVTVATASSGAAGKKIQVWIEYVVD